MNYNFRIGNTLPDTPGAELPNFADGFKKSQILRR